MSSPGLKIQEQAAMSTDKQGIGSLLVSSDLDQEAAKYSSSLRRTLSADMSSTRWLAQHGFPPPSSPIKKIASAQQLSSVSHEDAKPDDNEPKEPTQFDVWSSILSQKAKQESNNSQLPPPYIHPLVKRSSSSLSEKSLKICTESLGSETGSDGFSSCPSSETSDVEDDNNKEMEQQKQEQDRVINPEMSFDDEDLKILKYNYTVGKKSQKRSFPPPIPSLNRIGEGSSVRMECCRDKGRLVLEAVSVPSINNFLAQRQDGHLVLTFANKNSSIAGGKGVFEDDLDCFENDGEDETDNEEDDDDDDDDEIGNTDEMEIMAKRAKPEVSNRMISLHRMTVMVNKPMSSLNRNPRWPHKFNEAVKFDDVEVKPSMLAKSLPPRPKTMGRQIPKPTAVGAAGSSFNPYEYYWQPKPMDSGGSVVGPIKQRENNNNNKNMKKSEKKQEMFVLRGKKREYLVPLLKGCKEPRRSVLFWEPCCIATS